MKLCWIVASLVVLQGCAMASLGRMHPLLPTEREGLDCEALTAEIRKTDEFCAAAFDSKGYGKGSVTATLLLGPLGILSPAPYNNIELVRAVKSASIRQSQLTYEADAAGCAVVQPKAVCPSLCTRQPFVAVVTMENGFLGERCVVLNREERKTYAHLLGR